MNGVLDGVRVLDLSWGISGPVATMLLADHGAQVTKIEPPGGDPYRSLSGYRVWGRGKRSAVLNLRDAGDAERFAALAEQSDVVVESFSPGTTATLGIDYATLAARNPQLVYCSITAYGNAGRHAERPGYDALVAARTGAQWETRGVDGGTLARLAGTPGMLPGVEAPPGQYVGAPRPGPLFSGVPWISLATAYLANLGISAALRAREQSGRGQWVQTSLLQGALITTIAGWQRVERPETPAFQTWVIDPRAPKCFFRGSDGRWTHHWVPLPGFILGAAAGDRLEARPGVTGPRQATVRISTTADDMLVLHAYYPELAAAVAKFPSDEWVRLAAEVGVPVQPVRSPEEALLDPALLADGCVVELDDAEVGPIRCVGRTYELHRCPSTIAGRAPEVGEHTEEVKAQADTAPPTGPAPAAGPAFAAGAAPAAGPASGAGAAPRAGAGPAAGVVAGPGPRSPLDGVRVIDLGLAVAGPFGTQMLAQLGAEVIKVNTLTDSFWFSNHIAMCCNRDKRSITIDLKSTEGAEVLRRLVQGADVVHHNMRDEAAERLGVDYESLRALNPALVYCHTRGHDSGPRAAHPGNDQTAAALAGTEWIDGGMDHGGEPFWSLASLGDTGNGLLSAIAVTQALYHRDRTGEGQFVDTSILYAHLLNASTAWITPDGARRGERPELDAMQLGWSAGYGLYETASGWICVAAVSDAHWAALAEVLEAHGVALDGRFATAAGRAAGDGQLRALLAGAFAGADAAEWFARLDGAGVPVEISSPDFVMGFFDDPEAIDQGLVASFHHPVVGDMQMSGLLWSFSETPAKIWGPPVWPGLHTRAILAELGYRDDEIDKLLASAAVAQTNPEGG
jgi:crotonobetainyl-CoA:carnitine CoA-transferase CaiB-like acyl-CoA transferase